MSNVTLTHQSFWSHGYFSVLCHFLGTSVMLFHVTIVTSADIDECSLGQHQCSSYARCYNIHGSYKCQCRDGYEGDGLNCVCE